MDIKQDGNIIFSLSETCIKILKHDFPDSNVSGWISHYMQYGGVIAKRNKNMRRLKEEWVTSGKLAANGITLIPLNDIELAELIFSQPNYKDRYTQIKEARIAEIEALLPDANIRLSGHQEFMSILISENPPYSGEELENLITQTQANIDALTGYISNLESELTELQGS